MTAQATKLDAVYLERLNKVVEAVEKLPGEDFRLSQWRCGTHCCAVGAYCIANPDEQLKLDDRSPLNPPVLFHRDGIKRATGYEAVRFHFGIGMDNVMSLFHPCNYESKRGEPARAAVLVRLRAFIADHS